VQLSVNKGKISLMIGRLTFPMDEAGALFVQGSNNFDFAGVLRASDPVLVLAKEAGRTSLYTIVLSRLGIVWVLTESLQ